MSTKTKLDRPKVTLFLTQSVDGRITSHDSDDIDPDKAWKKEPRIQALTTPFYEFASGKIHTLTTGEVMAKMGVNYRIGPAKRLDTKLIVIDDLEYLTPQGIAYMASNFAKIYLVTLKSHPVDLLPQKPDNLTHLSYPKSIELPQLLHHLKSKHQIKEVTIHSNAKLNARWLSSFPRY
jgi:hypothetical protein